MSGPINLGIHWDPNFQHRTEAGFQRLQKEADGEFIRLVTPYVPVRTGALRGSAKDSTVLGAMFDMPLLFQLGESVQSANFYLGFNRFGNMTDRDPSLTPSSITGSKALGAISFTERRTRSLSICGIFCKCTPNFLNCCSCSSVRAAASIRLSFSPPVIPVSD